MTATTITPPKARAPLADRGWAAGDDSPQRDLMVQIAAFALLSSIWLNLLGPIAPLLVTVSGAAVVALLPYRSISGLRRAWPILLVAGFVCLSALWSTAPGITLRYGIQLAITLCIGVILAAALSPKSLLRIIFFSSLFVTILCLLSGRQGASPQGPVLIGFLGSKNEMGQLCQMTICSAATVAFASWEKPWVRLLALPAVAIGVGLLMHTFALGASLTTALFGLVALGFLVASRVPTGSKFLIAALVIAFVVPLWLIRGDLQLFYEYVLVDVFGKDVGLTGRDFLWAHADGLIDDRPYLGHGFRSTWLGSSGDTIGLLRRVGIASGAGFNFHDTFREWKVDFGWIGAVLIATLLAVGFIRLIAVNMGRQATLAGIFFAATAVIVIARGTVETLFGPFSSATLLIGMLAAMGLFARLSIPVTETATVRPAALLGVRRRPMPSRRSVATPSSLRPPAA